MTAGNLLCGRGEVAGLVGHLAAGLGVGPLLREISPQNALHDLLVSGRARAAPELAPLLTTREGPALDNLLQELLRQRSRGTVARAAGDQHRMLLRSALLSRPNKSHCLSFTRARQSFFDVPNSSQI